MIAPFTYQDVSESIQLKSRLYALGLAFNMAKLCGCADLSRQHSRKAIYVKTCSFLSLSDVEVSAELLFLVVRLAGHLAQDPFHCVLNS